MSILDIFKSSQGTNAAPAPGTPTSAVPTNVPGAPAGTPVQPGNINPPTDPAKPGQGVVPVESQEPKSPLDQFKTLWEPKTEDPNNPKPNKPTELTAEQLQKAVEKASFTQSLDPTQVETISKGGEEAQAAFMAALNTVARQVMVQATMVNNKLTEKAVTEAIEQERAQIPTLVREQQSESHLNDTSALFSNPAVKPVVEATRTQLLQKFPNATPAEITQMTQDYIKALGEHFAPPAPTSDPNEQDWNKFLSM